MQQMARKARQAMVATGLQQTQVHLIVDNLNIMTRSMDANVVPYISCGSKVERVGGSVA